MPEGWDSYGAAGVSNDAIARAVEVLMGLQFPLRAPLPSVVPGSSGSVQLEWHQADASVEIHISSRGTATAFLGQAGEECQFETIDQRAKSELLQVLSHIHLTSGRPRESEAT